MHDTKTLIDNAAARMILLMDALTLSALARVEWMLGDKAEAARMDQLAADTADRAAWGRLSEPLTHAWPLLSKQMLQLELRIYDLHPGQTLAEIQH